MVRLWRSRGRHPWRRADAHRPLRRLAQGSPSRRARRGGGARGDRARGCPGRTRSTKSSSATAARPVRARIRRGRSAHRAGIPVASPAQTINKACASSLQAIAAAAQSILLGESDCVVAGGIESMSRMPYLIDSADARWGHRMGNFPLVDAMYRDGFHDPLSNLIMGETAEMLARQYGITREASDQFALESQQKAEAAQKAGYFAREIAPITRRRTKAQSRVFDSDEHPRHGTTLDALAKLPLVFPNVEGQPGIITAGTSSGITDGGAALVLASDQMGRGPRPHCARADHRVGQRRCRSAPHGHRSGAGAEETLRALRPRHVVLRSRRAQRSLCGAGPRGPQGRRHPAREAQRQRRRDRAWPSRSAATGARMVVTLLYEMERRGVSAGLATLCVSGGMGMALAIESASEDCQLQVTSYKFKATSVELPILRCNREFNWQLET